MALLNARGPLIAALAALAILITYLPPQPPAERDYYRGDWRSYPTREARTAARLGDEYREAVERQMTRNLRDSVVRVMSRRAGRPGAAQTLATTRQLDSSARVMLREALPPVPTLSPEIQIVLAMNTGGPFSTEKHTFLPAGTDGRSCIVLFTVDTAATRLAPRHPRDRLGPCAFFAAFGLPGPGVARWLESRAYGPAWLPDWTLRPHAPLPLDRPTAADWFDATLSRVAGTTQYSGFGYGGLYYESGGLVGCAVGKIDGCRRYFFSNRARAVRYSLPGIIEGDRFFDDGSNRVLATLVREQGPKRFARFWRSRLPPEQAFDAAFTVPFDKWAPQWAQSLYPPLDFGTSTRPRELASSLLWIGVAMAACAGLALARRVS